MERVETPPTEAQIMGWSDKGTQLHRLVRSDAECAPAASNGA